MRLSHNFYSKAADCRIDVCWLNKLINKKNEDELKRMIAILSQAAQVYDEMARAMERQK